MIIRDLDGRKVRILFRGYRRYTKKQLFKLKQEAAERARFGLALFGKQRSSTEPNPALADRIEAMTLLQFCCWRGLVREFKIYEEDAR